MSRPPRDNSQSEQKTYNKPPIEAEQDNPTGEKLSQELAKGTEINLLSMLGLSPKHQDKSHNICAGDLVKTHVGPVLAVSVTLSQCEYSVVHWGGIFYWCPPSPLTHKVFQIHNFKSYGNMVVLQPKESYNSS